MEYKKEKLLSMAQSFKNPSSNDHECIKCGEMGLFLYKYRICAESPFFPAWFCIDCRNKFKPIHYDKKLGRVDYWGKQF